jgi:hypothetical protein
MFFVMRNTPGRGFGTSERVNPVEQLVVRGSFYSPYHVRSTPARREKRTSAWRIRATPPPCGVLEKKAILVRFARSFLEKNSIDCHVCGAQVSLWFWRMVRWALNPASV